MATVIRTRSCQRARPHEVAGEAGSSSAEVRLRGSLPMMVRYATGHASGSLGPRGAPVRHSGACKTPARQRMAVLARGEGAGRGLAVDRDLKRLYRRATRYSNVIDMTRATF